MGLAASQARLLTITARLADNELRSQTINNAKMRLATQSSQASENYINALNNAIYKFTNYDDTGAINNQQLTFNALTAYSSYNTQYGLINASGQILVSEEEGRLFEKAQGNLDAYLKEHGLEYKTTYFNGKEFTNNSYPDPFNHIIDIDNGSIDGLKTMYERYTSYETSVEVEKFENAFANYKTSNAYIEKAGTEILKNILIKEGNANQLQVNNDYYSINFGVTGAVNLVNSLKNAFLNNNNSYNIDNLKSSGYITEETYNKCNNIINSYNATSTGLNISKDVDMSYKEIKDGNGLTTGKEYNIGKLIVNTDTKGIVTSIDDTEFIKENGGDGEFAWYNNTQPQTGVSLENFINSIKFTIQNKDENNNAHPLTMNYSCSKDASNNLIVKNNYSITDTADQIDNINSGIDSIINRIILEANYTKLFEDIVNGKDLGISPDTIVTNDNKSIRELASTYSDSLQTFLGIIFSEESCSNVTNDLKNGVSIEIKDENGEIIEKKTITPENLQDIDFILQYIAQKEYISPSKGFETVIKKFIIDEVIEEYGTPNYAWVDSNDPNNTQNADAKAQWYTNLFNRMTRGYKTLEDGLASSAKWIEYALENGTVYMEQVDKSFLWKAMDYKTCSRITEETDDVAVAKAEAEYNRAMKDIENKDNIYDLELKNIDTEHNALQTEYDVIKGVISKNIERNFKFNQSA